MARFIGVGKSGKSAGRWWLSIGLGACAALAPLYAAAEHGFPHPELLGRGTFFEDVGVKFKIKGMDGGTEVLQLEDGSDMVVLRITLHAGAIAPWHTHTGPGTLINLGPGTLTNVVGDECMPRMYLPGDAFVDPGVGEPHAARNDSAEDVVLLAVFYGIEGGPVIPATPPEGCDFLP